MLFKALTPEEVSRVYSEHMIYDFPETELKPLFMLRRCMAEGTCRCFGLFDGEELAAYAVLLTAADGDAGILDYLAAVRTRRDQGVGSEMLRRLREEPISCAGLIIEYEHPADDTDDAERENRLRRERFYLKNGVRRTGIDLILYGVHFAIGFLPCERDLPDGEIKRMQKAVYDRVGSTKYAFLDSL